MDEGEKPNNPSDASPIDDTLDVDALLDQAAALAGEIATQTGSDAPEAEDTARAEVADPTDRTTEIEPESENEPADTPDSAPESGAKPGAEPDASASQAETNDVEGASDSESPQAKSESDEIDRTLASLESILDEQVEEKPADDASGVGGKGGGKGEAEEGRSTGHNTISLDDVAFEGEFGEGSDFEESEDESDDAEDQSASKKSVARVGSIKLLPGIIIAFVRTKGLSRVRRFGSDLPNFVARPLILIDGPFQHLSPRTKHFIGYAAIATVLAGIASLVIPLLMNKNPYVDMPF